MRSIPPSPGEDYVLVYTRTVRLRSGKVLKAEQYGLRAFAFWAKRR